MEKVRVLDAIAVPLLMANVNTDVIIRIERMSLYPRGELGPWALETLRLDAEGRERPDCILNQAPFRDARILLAGANFGCGSSREMAVWALQERGDACIIAPSFGDIFFNNCLQNGVLAIRLPAAQIEGMVVAQLRALFRTQEVIVGTWMAARGEDSDVTEAAAREALLHLDPLWDELFPAEQARIVRLLVERVEISPTGADIKLRLDGLASLMRDLRSSPVRQAA